MATLPTRREVLACACAVWADRPGNPVVDTHVHLFAADQRRFPYHANAPYKPPAQPLKDYLRFAATRIDHVVIVHPEPYQDDHRYLEYCFAHEPVRGFFKGTCLFDPLAPDTPTRMEALATRNPGRIVALRIHQMRPPGTPAAAGGAIKDRDMRDPAMHETWRKVQRLGFAIQMHFLPYYAPQIGELAARHPEVPVVLDHLARAGQGTPAEFKEVLKLSKLPRIYMKYSAINYSSQRGFPFEDAVPLVRAAYDSFGPDRMIWGGLGHSVEEYERQSRVFDRMFDFARESERARIRGLNAIGLFGWTQPDGARGRRP